ncbi:MAG: Uma2 family endonuclease [Hormoscilla sp. GM7CHS1pb]|nr:Uma2 family endonuclease [Hormoscilla sp. GM7CHS1pb]
MSVVKELETSVESPKKIIFPSGELLSEEPPLETYLHLQQLLLLIKCLDWWWKERQDFFSAGNLTIYYSPNQLKSEYFRGPDFFVVLGVERKPRKSWVVWQEDGKYPNIIVEILSETTASTDRKLKKEIYQDTFRTPNYFWFDPETLEFAGFVLVGGKYEALKPNSQGQLWSQELGLYLGIHSKQLHFFTPEGTLIPTPEKELKSEKEKNKLLQERAESAEKREQLAKQEAELAKQEAELAKQEAELAKQEAELAKQEAESAKQLNELLAAKLRELNIDPNSP